MTNDPTDPFARYLAEKQGREAQLLALKEELLEALPRYDIASVVIAYDGEGDSSQISAIAARDPTDTPVFLTPRLSERIEEFVWKVLAKHHDGFENNYGGFGKLTIDVAAHTVQLDHNDRAVESVNTTTEV